MKDFKKRGGFGDFKGRGGKPSFGGGYDRKPGFAKKSWGGTRANDATMHKAVCSECGKNCEVPFRPSGEKPVFCNTCFNPAGGSFKEGGRGGDRFSKKDFKPRGEYTSRQEAIAPATNDAVLKQLETLNSKIDRLISAVEALGQTPKVATPMKETPTVTPKKVAKKVTKKTIKK